MVKGYEKNINCLLESILQEISFNIENATHDLTKTDQGAEKILSAKLSNEKYHLLKWIPKEENLNKEKIKEQITKFSLMVFKDSIPISTWIDNQNFSGYFIFAISKNFFIKNILSNPSNNINFTMLDENYNILYSNESNITQSKLKSTEDFHKIGHQPLFIHTQYLASLNWLSKPSFVLLSGIILILFLLYYGFYLIIHKGLNSIVCHPETISRPFYFFTEFSMLANKIKLTDHINTQNNIRLENSSKLNKELQESNNCLHKTCSQLRMLLNEAIYIRDDSLESVEKQKDAINQLVKNHNQQIETWRNNFASIITQVATIEDEMKKITSQANKSSVVIKGKTKEKIIAENSEFMLRFNSYLGNFINLTITLAQAHSNSLSLSQQEHDMSQVINEVIDEVNVVYNINYAISNDIQLVYIDKPLIKLIILGLINCIAQAKKSSSIVIQQQRINNSTQIEVTANVAISALHEASSYKLCTELAHKILTLHQGKLTHKKKCLFVIDLPLLLDDENT